MYAHCTNSYQSSLLELHIRQVHTFITWKITSMAYCGTNSKFLTLTTELNGWGRGTEMIEGMEKNYVQCRF